MTDTKTLDPNKVNEVLSFIEDIFDRCQIPLIALKETGKQMRENQKDINSKLELTCIELGVQRRYMTQSGKPMLEGLFNMYHVNPEWNDSLIRFTKDEVPVFIKIIERKYGFFQNLERIFYRTMEFDIANPFDNYWKARHIVK